MRRDLSTQQSQQTVENIPQIGTTFRFEQANQVLSSLLLSNTFYAITVLLFSFQLNFDGNLLSVIYCIDSKLLLQLIHQLYYYRIFLHFNITEKHTLLRLISTLVEGSYLLVLNLYQIQQLIMYFFKNFIILSIFQIEFKRIVNSILKSYILSKLLINTVSGTRDLLLLSNIFPLLNIFLSVILKLNEGNQYFKQSISQINMFHVFRNIVLLIISLFLSLKLEGYLEIQWLYALWMFWILFGVSASIVIYYVFVVLALGIQRILEQNSRLKNLVIINFWILFFMISNTSMLLLVPISILNFHNVGNYGNIIEAARIILIINQVIFSYFTVKFKPEMVFTLQTYLSFNDQVNPLNTLPTQQGEAQLQQFNKQDFAESRMTEPHLQIPKVVKRISKTYFGFDDLPSDKKLETQPSCKRPTHQKALSSQIQRCSEDQNEQIKLSSLINIKISERQRSVIDIENNSQDIEQVNVPRSVSLSSINSCCICFDNEPNALFMQCGHGGVCYNCAIDLWKNKEECYLCRNKIDRVLQIKLSEQQKNIYQVVAATELNQKIKIEQKTLTQNQQQ